MTTWVVQNNLFNEKGFNDLVDLLKRTGDLVMSVKVVPFSREIAPGSWVYDGETIKDVEDVVEAYFDGPVVVYGSTSLVRIAQERHWTPGAWFNDYTFRHSICHREWGDHMLNADAKYVKFGDIHFDPSDDVEVFIRPDNDLKVFSGHVVHSKKFLEWQESCRRYSTTLTDDEVCVVALPKTILKEYRFFVVDGKVVTGSLYKVGDNVLQSSVVDPDATFFAQMRVNQFQPADAFVLDIALTPDGFRVIEINCLNSAGLYAIDVSKMVQAVDALAMKDK